MSDFIVELQGRTVEYFDDEHVYLVDGVLVPSVSAVFDFALGNPYSGTRSAALGRAAQLGTELHSAIEAYCKDGTESDLVEVRNFRFLQEQYCFDVVENELPVIVEHDGVVVCAGRFDMTIKIDGVLGGADIKRVSALKRERTALQLNLYRLGYKQCYGERWEHLHAIWLRGDVRRFVKLPINEEYTLDVLSDFKKWRTEYDG